jgi:hypothetical protein
MVCPERERLLAYCAETMRTYVRASIEWQDLVIQVNTPEYRDARVARNKAHAEVDTARLALNKHEHMHHCRLST